MLWPSLAQAKPIAPQLICDTYPESPTCLGQLPTCETCHTSTDPPQWNEYGAALFGALAGADFEEGLRAAMIEIEDHDDDGDTFTNLDEIGLGTNPGNPESWWEPLPEPTGPNSFFRLDEYDPAFAFKRMLALYCGYSPSYDDMEQFRALEDDQAQREHLHQALAGCLDSAYWRTEGLARLADKRIQPRKAAGAEATLIIADKRLVLGDYEWDYRLWRYALSDDRDMRELLTAQYHVEQDASGELTPVDGVIPNPAPTAQFSGGQPLQAEHRAGMITTQWFLVANTMLSDLPRTTAAQAYRMYLGMDISKGEGIWPIEAEPSDVDDMGVAQPSCALCHSTLDPLAYAFAYYDGIAVQTGSGAFREARAVERIPDWDPQAQQSMIFGRPVSSVVEWAAVAANSVYFRRTMANMFFEQAMGRPPQPNEAAEFAALVASLPDDGYSANRLIHRLVDTHAFGAP